MWDRIRIRDMTRHDGRALHAVFDGMSAASRERRFHGPVASLSPLAVDRLLDVDGYQHVALLAEAGQRRRREPIGIARFVREPDDRAEIAVEVVDAWQGRGVGSRLVRALADRARRDGVRELYGDVLADNAAMQHVLARQLPAPRFTGNGPTVHVRSPMSPGPLVIEDILVDLGVAGGFPAR